MPRRNYTNSGKAKRKKMDSNSTGILAPETIPTLTPEDKRVRGDDRRVTSEDK